jgi:endonuclease-3 related protein
VDSYTRRIFSRLGLVQEQICYNELRDFFMERLPLDAALFNEYHALIVELGKNICRPTPRCHSCYLLKECKYGGALI